MNVFKNISLTLPCIFPPNVERAWYTTIVTSPVTDVLIGKTALPSSNVYCLQI